MADRVDPARPHARSIRDRGGARRRRWHTPRARRAPHDRGGTSEIQRNIIGERVLGCRGGETLPGPMEDRNKLHHIFGNPDHNLDALVSQYGNEKAAGLAILEAVNQEAYHAGTLIVDARGRYKQELQGWRLFGDGEREDRQRHRTRWIGLD